MDKLSMLNISYFYKDEDLEQEYQKLCKEEEEIEKEFESLYSEKEDLCSKLSDLPLVLHNIQIAESDTKELSNIINDVATLAENINSKIRKLDIGTNNVLLCQKRVHDLFDLQLCSDGVQSALQDEDYETAAGHIHRFLSMDQQLLKQAATDMARDCEAVTSSVKLLRDAAALLQNKISLHFKEAVSVKDPATVDRFFKLFPLAGMRDYGLEQYSNYLCYKLQDLKMETLNKELQLGLSGKRSKIIFADVLTLLFEEIAQIMEKNQPLIETYYGSGNLFKVLENLQAECDAQTKQILQHFSKTRQLDFIVQTISDYSRNLNSSKMERIDATDIDILLDEITIIHSRYQLYRKFIYKKISADFEVHIVKQDELAKKLSELESCLNNSETCKLMQGLICQYVSLEQYYMEENIKKAITSDMLEEGSQVSSLIDDIFFIVRKCIRRTYSSSNIDAVCAIINNSCATLETDVCNAMRKKLKQGYSSGYLDLAQAYNVMLQQSDPEHTRLLFLAHLNNSEMCIKYINTLCETLRDEIRCNTHNEKEKIDSCLSSLNAIASSFTNVNQYGLQQLQITVVKSRVVPWIDSFLSFNHQLTEDEFSSYQADEPFTRRLIRDLETLLAEFKTRLTSQNYEAFISIIVSEVTTHIEKVILKTEFNRLGGLALNKEVRTLFNYFSNATLWSVRDKFSRLIQIATVLNLDKVSEISEYWNSSNTAFTWKLTPKEIKQFLLLRKDFKPEDVRKLKL